MSKQKQKKPYTKEEYRREKKKQERKSYLLACIIGLIIVAGVLGYYYVRAKVLDTLYAGVGNPETLVEDLTACKRLKLVGGFDDINLHGSLEENGTGLAGMREAGTINPVVQVYVDDQVVFSFQKTDAFQDENIITAYEFLDQNDNVLCYAVQDLEHGSYSMKNVDKQNTGYVVEQNGKWIVHDSETVANCDYFPSSNDSFYYQIEGEYEEVGIPAYDKCFMLYLEYLTGYNYNANGVIP